jgi:hypothetical protein
LLKKGAQLQSRNQEETSRRTVGGLNSNYANKRQLSEIKIKPQNESKRKRSEQRRAGSSVSGLRFKALSGSVFHGLEFWAPFRKSVSVFLCRSKLAFIGVIGVQNPPVRTFFRRWHSQNPRETVRSSRRAVQSTLTNQAEDRSSEFSDSEFCILSGNRSPTFFGLSFAELKMAL